ncbi:MAG: 16S rRNA (cytidine(1402)-2'-O)-methyltransferase [Acidimicrobiia bacterium]|nr:16S rRNA (cytidine(1402)-2'-O)-methyltransferase [Acidimicrobiia bacterium]
MERRRLAVAGLLILCGTPLGNLGDAPPRLAEALSKADCIYAEDTRRSGRLLDALGVRPRRLRSYFAGNESARTAELAGRLAAGDTVALLTDAGTPGISDPGLSAVRAALRQGTQVTVIPGPSAVTAALAVSGLPANRFSFEGFLPRSGERRARRIRAVASSTETVVLFSSPHRLVDDLSDLAGAGLGDRSVSVARELSKLHEEIWRGSVSEALAGWTARPPRGEFTLVLAGCGQVTESLPMSEATEAVGRLVAEGLSTSAAVREVSRLTGVPRRDLYESAHGNRG